MNNKKVTNSISSSTIINIKNTYDSVKSHGYNYFYQIYIDYLNLRNASTVAINKFRYFSNKCFGLISILPFNLQKNFDWFVIKNIDVISIISISDIKNNIILKKEHVLINIFKDLEFKLNYDNKNHSNDDSNNDDNLNYNINNLYNKNIT